MATLPRMCGSKHKTSVSTPFSTSPRKLQEMTLPIVSPDGHDVTTASGISMKQYEEQLNGLRKENFHLKLRIYFLEEKLGTGTPPAVQGLLEHNVRLQVEVEELRRQLNDKQELLAAAAEAIDVLEQQGSMSTDSVDGSINNSVNVKKEECSQQDVTKKEDLTVDTCAESESAGDYLGTTVNNENLDELIKLRKENRKALQMIKGCMKKIQQQDKELKKIKLDRELAHLKANEKQLEKYEEILKCKNEHIKDLESKVRELQKATDGDDNSGNLQQLLTRRLQGLAYFLDKLLSHKCVLGEDKKRLAESILEQSLALPVGLKLDESMAPEEFTLDESAFEMSQSMRIEDLTLMFGHHGLCSDDGNILSIQRHKNSPQVEIMSESECWSEPDRNVSLARIGLCDAQLRTRESTSDNNRYRARRSRVSHGSRSDERFIPSEDAIIEEIGLLSKRIEQLERENTDLNDKLEFATKQIDELLADKERLNAALEKERSSVVEVTNSLESMKSTVSVLESRAKDTEQQLSEAGSTCERLRVEKSELEESYMETERALRRAADEATLQASQAALERARVHHDKMRLEVELEETRERLAAALSKAGQLELELTRAAVAVEEEEAVEEHPVEVMEEERPTSPDQGIDSDRLSSLDQNDLVALSPRSLYEENLSLKQKLARTKATLAETLAQLNAANARKRSVQRAICREIHKTHGVLRRARDHLDTHAE